MATTGIIHIDIQAQRGVLREQGSANGVHSYLLTFQPKFHDDGTPDERANDELELLTGAVCKALDHSKVLEGLEGVAAQTSTRVGTMEKWPAITLTFDKKPSREGIASLEREIARAVEAEYKHIALQAHGGHEAPGTEILPPEIVAPTLRFTGAFGEMVIPPTEVLKTPDGALASDGYATNAGGQEPLRAEDVAAALQGRAGNGPQHVRIMPAVSAGAYEAAPETVKMEALGASSADIVSAVFQVVRDNMAGGEIHDASTLKANIASDAIVAAATTAVAPKVGGDSTAARLDVVAVINAMRKFVDSNAIATASGMERMLDDAGAKGFIVRQLEKARANRQSGHQR